MESRSWSSFAFQSRLNLKTALQALALNVLAGLSVSRPTDREALIILGQKIDYTEDEISTFQKKIDIFANGWLELNGAQGMTNYIHMLASGHIAEYMRHWKNLYRHSQQGWEAFNSHFKSYFFRRTGRGGAGNKGLGVKSRLIPIARWLQRRMVWMSQASVEDMKAFYKEKG
jgi:hypothetical protein